MHITVNGTRHDVPRSNVSYETVATLAGHADSKELLIKYHGGGVSGQLRPGDDIAPAEGLTFRAATTGNG